MILSSETGLILCPVDEFNDGDGAGLIRSILGIRDCTEPAPTVILSSETGLILCPVDEFNDGEGAGLIRSILGIRDCTEPAPTEPPINGIGHDITVPVQSHVF